MTVFILNMDLKFSFIIPVYNRPDEIEELLASLVKQTVTFPFEVVIIEDGSTVDCKEVVSLYNEQLDIQYIYKENSGPGDSRNYGMQKAKGNYFIVLDSDCIIPEQYLDEVVHYLEANYIDCFGGPDAAHDSFSDVQKAINYVMTSLFTTGGIRGNKKAISKFQPRSFNMGISKKAFEATKGFGNIHPGEDPDLTIRIWNAGFETVLIPKAFVYHKRRIDWSKFYKQVHKFGMVRPILNEWHPETSKITYWFPSVFCFGFIISALFLVLGINLFYILYALYFLILFVDSLLKNKSIKIAVLSIFAVCIQFIGYGYGFIKSTIMINVLKKNPKEVFPHLFFNL